MLRFVRDPSRPCQNVVTSTVEPLEGRVLLHGGHPHGPVAPVAATPDAVHVRINAGGGALVDSLGAAWERDRYGRGGGRGGKRIYDVAGTADDQLYAQCRAGKSIRYAIPVPAGTYTVNLLFADPKFTAAGQRVFNVFAEGQPVLAPLDIAASGGGRSATVRTLTVTVGDGALDLAFYGVVGKAIVSGIEVFQGEAAAVLPASGWQAAAPVPITLFEAQAAAVADKLYVFGGFHNGTVQATPAVYAYDPVTNVWTPRANMPVAVTHAGVAVDGASVWVVGGLLGDYRDGSNLPTRDAWRYDTVTDTWAAAQSLPAASGAGGLAIVGREMHYFGGFAPDGQRDSSQHHVLDLDALDPATKWRSAASMPTARNHFGTAVVGGKIYAIGGQHGRDETNRNLRDVHLYDPATDRWSSGPRLPKPMSHFHNSTVVQNGRILIAGGVTNGRFPLSDVFEYDPATSQWTAAAPMPAPRKAPLALIAAGRLYVLTGSPGDNFPQNDVWYRTVA
jgi:N-acetylneuraminic acid mutarotase